MTNKKLKPCKLPENHRDYYYIIKGIDRKTGKQKDRQIYPNLFNTLVSIPKRKGQSNG